MAFTFRINAVPNLTASVDLSAAQFLGMIRDNANLIEIADGAAYAGYVGVLQDKPSAAGMPALVAGIGSVCTATAGGTIGVGDLVKLDTGDGMFVVATDGDVCFGIAETAGTDGEEFVVTLIQPAAIADTGLWGIGT